MCGIIGYVGEKDAVPLILNGLKKLEYRGYDSAGLAVYSEDEITVVKRKGRIEVLKDAVESGTLYGSAGIGHTRWATHGEPSNENSHPHVGEKKKIVIVHNGIIENYKLLKQHLEKKGIRFTSETDSEIVAQLAEYYYDGDIIDTVIKVTNAIEGSYALGIMCTEHPNKIVAVKKDSPLIVGINGGGCFIASDVPAILEHTRDVYYMEDKEIALLDGESVSFYNRDKEPIEKELVKITWDMQSAEKGGYEHFMFKEIMEQPKIIESTVSSFIKEGKLSFEKEINISKYNKILITACGSAYNAGMVGKYVFEQLARIPVEVDLASEFRYRDAIIDDKTLIIVISQSGETADTIAAMREAKRKGATVVAIANVIGSTIAKEADNTLYTLAGPEIAVATTKAFSAQLAVLYLLGIYFAEQLGKINETETKALLNELKKLPEKINIILQQTDKIQQYAASTFNSKSIFYIGRNIDYAIALEGSLKLKEISYIHSEAYAGGELKHGTISLIEEGTLVVAVCCCLRLFEKTWSNIEQVVSRGANVLFITDKKESIEAGAAFNEKLFEIKMPKTNELFSPSISVIVLQLFSYYIAANKGCDIDKPRNLAKSVTVE